MSQFSQLVPEMISSFLILKAKSFTNKHFLRFLHYDNLEGQKFK